MRETRTYGSVQGALRNERPYRDGARLAAIAHRGISDTLANVC
jgi:hypothetical protein